MSTIIDSATIGLKSAEFTHLTGASLAQTLYNPTTTITLSGDLGAGKTTFLQGLLRELGVQEHITSPTYSLEQRYKSSKGEILHLDLYRLSANQAAELVATSDGHEGIRCIEWSDRLPSPLQNSIHIHIDDTTDRTLTITFNDIPLPTSEDVATWRQEVMQPQHIIDHCNAVADFAEYVQSQLLTESKLSRPTALRRAAELHDLLRFVDFKPHGQHYFPASTPEQEVTWQPLREKYTPLKHEPACADFVTERGYRALGDIIRPHGLTLPSPDRTTIEQQLLYYADKRVKFTEVVSLDERFADFAERYGQGAVTKEGKIWLKEAKEIEGSLFPNGAPTTATE